MQIAEPEGFGQKKSKRKKAGEGDPKLPVKCPAKGDPAQRSAAITQFFKTPGVPSAAGCTAPAALQGEMKLQ